MLAVLLLFTSLTSHAFSDNHIYKIVNRSSGKALAIGGDYWHSLQLGSQAVQQTYVGGSWQQWYVLYLAPGVYNIRSRCSGQILETGGSSTAQWASTNQWIPDQATANTQRWDVKPDPNASNDGSWIMINQNSQKLLTPYYNSSAENTLVTQASSPGTIAATSQKWDIIDESFSQPDVYQIVNMGSGKHLSANTDNKQVSQNSILTGNSYSASQQWSLADAGNGEFYIINRDDHSGMEIGGTGDLRQPGRAANVWTLHGGPEQRWLLTDVSGNTLTLAQAIQQVCFIKNVYSGLILEIGGGGNQPLQENSAANQWYYVGTANQQWSIQYVSMNRSATTGPLGSATKKPSTNATLEPHLILFPNPASNLLSVSLPSSNTSDIHWVRITDMNGRLIATTYQKNGEIDISNLEFGIYVLTAFDGYREYHQKFTKN